MPTVTTTVDKRSIRFLFGMCAVILGANLVWISYSTILLPTLVENVVTRNKGLVVGLLGFVGTLIGITASIMWGIISDHTTSKWGKRSPAILIGALVAFPLIGLPALIFISIFKVNFFYLALPIIITSYFGMQFTTNMTNGAWWPLLVDIVDENQRGLASGIQGLFTLGGSAIGILVVTSLNQNSQTGKALCLVGGVFALTGIINTWVIQGKDLPAETTEKINMWDALTDMFNVRTHIVVFFWLVVAMLLANMGINSLQFFARYFFQIYFPAISPDAAYRVMGGISLVVTMLAAVGLGFLSDKIGRRAMILWALIACTIFTLLMGFASSFTVFLALATLRAVAMGPILATAPALASDLSPKDEAGRYMAYNNLSTGLSGGIAALIFGVLLINMTKTTFMFLFVISAFLFLAGGVVFATKVSQKELEAGYEAVASGAEGLL
jgi:MFS family permease